MTTQETLKVRNAAKYSIFPDSNRSEPLSQLAHWFGDSDLQKMRPESKLHLLAILAQWQAGNTQQEGYYSLTESFYGYAFFDDVPEDVEHAIVSLSGLTNDDCFHLMVALALQIKHWIYQSLTTATNH